jgi:hypothetical protein
VNGAVLPLLCQVLGFSRGNRFLLQMIDLRRSDGPREDEIRLTNEVRKGLRSLKDKIEELMLTGAKEAKSRGVSGHFRACTLG